MEKVVRLPLIENLDYKYGYITDGFVDISSEKRASFMARPSIQVTKNMGLPATKPFGTPTFVVAQTSFSVLTADKNAVYHSFTYTTNNGSGGSYVGCAIYSTGTNTIVGGSDITNNVALNNGVSARSYVAAQNVFYLFNTAIVSGGTGYSVNDTINLSINGVYRGIQLKVTSVSSGVITGVSVVTASPLPSAPTNPVGQLTTSGGGSGATFNLTFRQAKGVVIVYGNATSNFQSSNAFFSGVDTVNSTYVGQPLYNVNNTIASFLMLPTTVSLNNYQFYLDSVGNLWNSNVGDPSYVDPLSFTNAFSDPSTIPYGLAIHNGYLVVVGSNQIRYFQVIGAINGSAVAPIQNIEFGVGSSLNNGVYNRTISFVDEHLAFVGENDGTGISVYMCMPNSLSPQKITYPYLDNLLSQSLPSVQVYAGFIKFRGHLCYQLSFVGGNTSFVYDTVTKLWYLWMIYVDSTTSQNYLNAVSNFNDMSYMFMYNATANVFYYSNFQPAGSDTAVGATPNVYTPIIRLKPLDFGTMQSKQFSSACLVGDQTNNALTASIFYSDDNNLTQSNYRSVLLSRSRDITRNLGRAYRRQWGVQLPTDWEARVDAIEVGYRGGVT